MSESDIHFILRIYIAGISMFAPRKVKRKVRVENQEEKIYKEVDELVVLMPNLQTPQRIKEVIGNEDLKVHQPAILYLVPNRASDVPRYPLLHDDQQYLNGLWLIDREDLEIVDSKGDPLYGNICADRLGIKIHNDYKNNATGPEHYPKKPYYHDCFWMSPIRKEKGGLLDLQKIRPNLVDDEMVDPNQDVAGRMILATGELKNAGYAYNPESDLCHLYHLGSVSQAISTLVYVDIPVKEDRVYIKASKFTFETPSETLWSPLILKHFPFEYSQANGPKIVEICLLNLEYDEAIQFIPATNDQAEARKRLRLEHGFLLRLLEGRDQPNPPDFEEGEKPPPQLHDEYLIQHPPWRRWLMPNKNGQSPATSGNCKSQFTAKTDQAK